MKPISFKISKKPVIQAVPLEEAPHPAEAEISRSEFMRRLEQKVDLVAADSLDQVSPASNYRQEPRGNSADEYQDDSFNPFENSNEVAARLRAGEIRSSTDLTKAGLVMVSEPQAKGESKYIKKMLESGAERKQFSELMQMKFYQKEKEKLREEIGAEPMVFVTKGYKDVISGTSTLERKLAEIDKGKRGGLGGLFRNVLDASNARREIHQEINIDTEPRQPLLDEEGALEGEAAEDHLEDELLRDGVTGRVLDRLVPIGSSSLFTNPATEAKREVAKVLAQLESLEEDRDDKISAARERYMARKRQKLS